MFDAVFSKFKLLLKSPMVIFIYSIITKWYIMVMVPAVVVTFWVLKGLTEAGVLSATQEVVVTALQDTKAVARYCVPKITKLDEFWRCLNNPPAYEPTPEEVEFEQNTKQLFDHNNYQRSNDPYAE